MGYRKFANNEEMDSKKHIVMNEERVQKLRRIGFDLDSNKGDYLRAGKAADTSSEREKAKLESHLNVGR